MFRPNLYINDCIRLQLRDQRVVHLKFLQPKAPSKADLKTVAEHISKVFGRGFWHSNEPEKRWSVDKIMQRLPKVSLITLALTSSRREPIGYGLFERVTYGDHKVLFIDSMAVSGAVLGTSSDWQHSGLGVQILLETLKRIPSNTVAARTQNPVFISVLQKLKPKALLPLTTYYKDENLELLKILKETVAELKKVKDIDLRTGLCKKAYWEGKLGDYKADRSDTQIDQIENRFEQIGLDRDGGDAIVVVAKDIKAIKAVTQ